MDSYNFSNQATSDGSEIPISVNPEAPSNNLSSLSIGNLDTTGYTFPTEIGFNTQILSANTSTKSLNWTNQPVGDIVNGGQTGAITVGSSTSYLTLQGNQGIRLSGGIKFQYDEISLTDSVLLLTDTHYFVNITGSGNNILILPSADTRSGKKYIISKGYIGGTLIIEAPVTDSIEGDSSTILTIKDQRIQLTASGNNIWIVL